MFRIRRLGMRCIGMRCDEWCSSGWFENCWYCFPSWLRENRTGAGSSLGGTHGLLDVDCVPWRFVDFRRSGFSGVPEAEGCPAAPAGCTFVLIGNIEQPFCSYHQLPSINETTSETHPNSAFSPVSLKHLPHPSTPRQPPHRQS